MVSSDFGYECECKACTKEWSVLEDVPLSEECKTVLRHLLEFEDKNNFKKTDLKYFIKQSSNLALKEQIFILQRAFDYFFGFATD